SPAARRAPLGLESLDERVTPSTVGLAALRDPSLAGRFGGLTASAAQASSPTIFNYASVTSLLNKPLNMVNGSASYGSVTFNAATANSDGGYTLDGVFTTGALQIPVTATLGAYQLGSSLGYTATLSIQGLVVSTNPQYPTAGYSVQ